MYPRIAYTSSAPDPDLELAFAGARLTAEAVGWDADVAWDDFDLVLVRSVWDEAGRRQDFLRWARAVEEQTQLANPARVLARTSDRTYLRDLARRGVPIIPAAWFEPGDDAGAFAQQLALQGWDRFVVEANIRGAGEAHVFGTAEAAAAGAARVAARGGVAMVHPQTSDRVSIAMLGGVASHAVDASGQTVTLPDSELSHVVLDEDVLYARVDVVQIDGGWVVADVDAAGPDLFLTAATAERVARAVRVLLSPPTEV